MIKILKDYKKLINLRMKMNPIVEPYQLLTNPPQKVYSCPTCGEPIRRVTDKNYCNNKGCGQALYWLTY